MCIRLVAGIPALLPALEETLHECEDLPLTTSASLHASDFVDWGCDRLEGGSFAAEPSCSTWRS